MSKKALVVEDDFDTASLLGRHLTDCGFQVDFAHDTERGIELGAAGGYDIVILDWVMPGAGGLEVCKRLKSKHPGMLILMLTSRAQEAEKVLGLTAGADDYLAKPFGVDELMARVRAMLRRREMSAGRDSLSLGDLRIEKSTRMVYVKGSHVQLSDIEYALLLFLASSPGKAYTREELLRSVWGGESQAHTVNSHINRLRMKIEPDPEKPIYVRTVRGIGYCFGQQV